MKIDLTRIEEEPFELHERLTVPVSRLDPGLVAEAVRVDVTMTVRAAGESYSLDGTVSMGADLLCARCLGHVPWGARESFHLKLVDAALAPTEEEIRLNEEDMDVAYYTDSAIDVVDVVVEQILLALPMRTLCREDCAGVCPVCGADRNEQGACRCEPEPDPRWQALAGLRSFHS